MSNSDEYSFNVFCSHLEFTGVHLENWPEFLHLLSKQYFPLVLLYIGFIFFSLTPDADIDHCNNISC